MSAEAFTSTELTSVQEVGVQQEESESPVEYGSDIEQIKDNDVESTERDIPSGVDDTLDQSAVTNADIRPLQHRPQEDVATGGTGTEDSKESSVSGGASGSESLQARSGSDAVTQQVGGIGTESNQGGEKVALDRQLSHESITSKSGSGTESQEDSGNGTELQLSGAVGGASSLDSQGSATDGGSSNGNAGDVSNSPDTMENSAGAESFAGAAGSVPRVVFWKNIEERSLETAELTRSYEQCFNKCACICDYMRPCSIWIRRSKIFVFLKTLLLVLPISAFFMGLNYLSGCPAAGELPILMMLMGVAGVILIISSLGLDSRRTLCPSAPAIYFRALIMTCRLMFVGLFATGLDRTYAMSPSFHSSDKDKYCDEVFYNYAYYTNFVVIGIAVLSFFIYVPSFDQNIEAYEQL